MVPVGGGGGTVQSRRGARVAKIVCRWDQKDVNAS